MALAVACVLKDILPTRKHIHFCQHFLHRILDIHPHNRNIFHRRGPNPKNERRQNRPNLTFRDDNPRCDNSDYKQADPSIVIKIEIGLHSMVPQTSIIIDETSRIRLRIEKRPKIPQPISKQEPHPHNNHVKSPDTSNRLAMGSLTRKGWIFIRVIIKKHRLNLFVLQEKYTITRLFRLGQ